MKQSRFLALSLALSIVAAPALAQMAPGMGAGGAPRPRPQSPEQAPPAPMPGALTAAPLATAPKPKKAISGDPTQALFTAINNGDYNAAQEALSQGANIDAQNQFGETPLQLSIALNRDKLTFLLLQTRNELAAQNGTAGPMGAPWTLQATPMADVKTKSHAAPALSAPPRQALPASPPGTPDPAAGFLGFGAKN